MDIMPQQGMNIAGLYEFAHALLLLQNMDSLKMQCSADKLLIIGHPFQPAAWRADRPIST